MGETLFGQDAERLLDELESNTDPGPNTQRVWDMTQQEITEGRAGPLMDRQELLRQFGWGQCRPLPRHVIYGRSLIGGKIWNQK